MTQRWATRRDGSPLRLVVVRPAVPRRQVPGVLWIHGGGYAIGAPEQSLATARRLVTANDAGLRPTLTFVGDIEPFHHEVVDRCERLRAAGVPVGLEIYRGAVHGFDLVAGLAPISRQARAFLIDGFRDHLARYRAPQPAQP